MKDEKDATTNHSRNDNRAPRRESTGERCWTMTWSWAGLVLALLVCWGHNVVEAAESSLYEKLNQASSRIVGGRTSDPLRYPYAAVLLERLSDLSVVQRCGAVLIGPDVLLTAAHCPPESYNQVELNGFDYFRPQPTMERFVVRRVVRHPQHFIFDPDTVPQRFDVALVFLWGRALQTEPVSLDGLSSLERGESILDSAATKPAALTAIGWGLRNPFLQPSEDLQEIDNLLVVPNEVCRTAQDLETNVSFAEIIFPEMMCAQSPTLGDTCLGDSGGPLLLPRQEEEGGDVVVGLVSYGVGCGSAIFPGVYSRVASAAEWIREATCEGTWFPDDVPDAFNCSRPSDDDDDDNEEDPMRYNLTLTLQLDAARAFETGWLLQQAGSTRIYEYVPLRSYTLAETVVVEHLSLEIPEKARFELVLLDSGFDGFAGDANPNATSITLTEDRSGRVLVQWNATSLRDWPTPVFDPALQAWNVTNHWVASFALQGDDDDAHRNAASASPAGQLELPPTTLAPTMMEPPTRTPSTRPPTWMPSAASPTLPPTATLTMVPSSTLFAPPKENCLRKRDSPKSTFRVYLPSKKTRSCLWLLRQGPIKILYYCHAVPRVARTCLFVCNPSCGGRDGGDGPCRAGAVNIQGSFPRHVRQTANCKWLRKQPRLERRRVCAQGPDYFPASAQTPAQACPQTCLGC